MSSFVLYIIGYIILIAGLAIGANRIDIPPRWIAVGVIVLLGIGIVSGVAKTRRRDPPSA